MLDQSPPGDRKVDRGTTVTISVGRFDPDLNPDPSTDEEEPPPPDDPQGASAGDDVGGTPG